MRVRATATGTSQSNAIGQVELACTPAGLSVGLYGVGAYSDGYATGALTTGTRFTVPYSGIRAAREQGEEVYLELDAPGFPHDRLTLSRFTAGPGVPLTELRKRRLILHFTALSLAAIACLSATILAPAQPDQTLAWGALGYGLLAAFFVLGVGYSIDQSLFLRPPSEVMTRSAFLGELEQHYPHLMRTGATPPVRKKRSLPDLAAFLPRTATTVGITMAATILTALVTGQRLLMEDGRDAPVAAIEPQAEPAQDLSAARAPLPEPAQQPAANASELTTPADSIPTEGQENQGEVATVERRCLCDRADSQLWKKPIPKLSGVLIERRAIQLKNYVKTQAEIAVVNNSDSPIHEITVHVQFSEPDGKKMRATKERPLYFEGPLQPGEAVKWSTEARGTQVDIAIPDLGNLGPNGDGAAPADNFFKLLEANHRPVRLHAVRLLSYLGDARAREAALHLKDAMRAAEAPYLRRVLSATGDIRVCDVEVQKDRESTVGACVYNASNEDQNALGIQLKALEGSLDADHPLADPPQIRTEAKWQVPGPVGAQSGRYVRVKLPAGFLSETESSLEVVTDRYDLLD